MALGQLESAILLWFHEADPVSILVLASNAEDCLYAIGKKAGKSPPIKAAIESAPASFRERARYVQDFAKHGAKDLDEPVDHAREKGTLVIASAVDAYSLIYSDVTPIMLAFWMRFCSETPQLAADHIRAALFEDGAIYDFIRGSRKEFFDEFFPYIARGASRGRRGGSHLP